MQQGQQAVVLGLAALALWAVSSGSGTPTLFEESKRPDFDAILNKTFNFEGGYQAFPNDRANYNSKKQLVGTNHGISALAYEQYLKRPPTVADMKAITVDIAKDVYRKLFWNTMLGDQIKQPGLAWLIFDWHIATGAYSFTVLKKFINLNLGTNLDTKPRFDVDTLIAVNSASNKRALFDAIKRGRLIFVDQLIKKRPELAMFRNGWERRINAITYDGAGGISGPVLDAIHTYIPSEAS